MRPCVDTQTDRYIALQTDREKDRVSILKKRGRGDTESKRERDHGDTYITIWKIAFDEY